MRPFVLRLSAPAMKATNSARLDRIAIVLSALCLVHCIALPLALVVGGVFGGWLGDTETQVHWLLLALALPVSAIALYRGYRRHKQALTPWLGGVGLVLMFFGVSHLLGPTLEVVLTVIGVLLVLAAHIRNALQHQH